MTAKTKSWITFGVVFGLIVGLILYFKWDQWSRNPIQALYWWIDVLIIIILSLVLAPITFRVLRALIHIYVLIGTVLARALLGNMAAKAAERGETRDQFLASPLFRSTVIQKYVGWMHFGDDRVTIDRLLTPALIGDWIIFGWPLAVMPLILEETLPFFLIVLGLAPVVARYHARRGREVKDAIAKAFPAAVSDSSGPSERP